MVKNKACEETDTVQNEYKHNIQVSNRYDYTPKIYTINFWHEFDSDASIYLPYFQILDNAKEEDIIVFYFNSPGGSIQTLNLFINAMRRCKSKQILARVNYAASAAALLALFCDNIEFNQNSTLMLHTYSALYYGKQQEITSNVEHDKQVCEKLIRYICAKILNEKEMEELLNGKDFYFTGEEAIKRLKIYANKKIKEIKKSLSKNSKK